MRHTLPYIVFGIWLISAGPAFAQQQPPEKTPVILDTDIGTDMDDSFALALILASPELDLRGVTTVGGSTQTRALMACRFLTMTGRRHTQVAAGSDQQPSRSITSLYPYYYHPDVIFNRTRRPEKESAVEFLYSRLKAQPGKITIIAAGPLANLGRLISEKPDSKPLIKKIILSEDTLGWDVKASQAVLKSGISLVVIPSDHTANLRLTEAQCQRIFSPATALTLQIQSMYQMWDQQGPTLADTLAAAMSFNPTFCDLQDAQLSVDNKGQVRVGNGEANAKVTTKVRSDAFLKWYVERLSSCVSPYKSPAKFVEQGGFPNRVHVAEEFDNDIERRWWMSGKDELKNLPPNSLRAVRGVLTHDFDDLLGHPKAMHTAVIFNPVPGPPMGKNPRLSFRYFLKGTDTMRVQIYSLTNGYHRNLVLTGLPQGRWESGTVDMTVARRPDGTGGPLSEGERIDDIQFYIDPPTAELIIDDIYLYDVAVPGEKRPFPKRIFFTGLFDSGKQGKEWPGDFNILPQKGFFWNAAQSVENKGLGHPWIRIHLRGERAMGEVTHLCFRYHLTGADSMRVVLLNRTSNKRHAVALNGLKKEMWQQVTVNFNEVKGAGPVNEELVDDVHFLLPPGAELIVDDVLLYEPGK